MQSPQLSPTRESNFPMKRVVSTVKRVCSALLLFVLFQCADSELLDKPAVLTLQSSLATTDTELSTVDCNCTYTVPANTHRIDGAVLGIKPGSVICLNSTTSYLNLLFVNLVGTPDNPIIIRNCGGAVNIKAYGKTFAMKTQSCKYFRITGSGSGTTYGIKLSGASLGLTLDYLSTNFEVDRIEVYSTNFAGIMAKTDPSCDDATIRGNFTMRDIRIHNNYVHDTGGEALYIGNSFYQNGMTTLCGIRFPHSIEGVEIDHNKVKNSGWESIQLGSATKNASVHDNIVENYGVKNVINQRNGIQIGEGTGGVCYNNYINGGIGNGLLVLGLGDNVVHDNVIVNAGMHGIFCDERYTPGPGFIFLNNTIITPKQDGIRIYADLVPMNVFVNNIVINPGSYGKYPYPRTGLDSYVYKLSKYVNLQMTNNKFTRSTIQMKFIDPTTNNYRLGVGSPAIDAGKNIGTYNIQKDFYLNQRLKGLAYDVGACEF
jgi:hypothetical protein